MAPADEFDPVEHATTSQAARTEPVVLGESEETDGTKLIPKNHTQTLTQRLNPSLTLENSGSVARDHLALERTFLAYMRTSLTIAGTGVALVQLFTISSGSNEQLRKFTHPLGATVIVIGMLTLLTGVLRFFSVQDALTKGKFPVARLSIGFLAFLLTTIVVVVFGTLVAAKKQT